MFDSAAGRYILLNKVLTFGRDEIWRNKAVGIIRPQKENRILDICTGTADFAVKIAKKFPDLTVYALDYSPNMLAAARKRAMVLAQYNLIFKEGDCTDMEFKSDYFDYVTISFGFRNLSYSQDNLVRALKEVYRVLKKDGRFLILETNQPANRLIRMVFHFYAGRIVPLLGRFFSGKREPYLYLGNSIVKFFDKDKLMDILSSVGFKQKIAMSFMWGGILLCVVHK